MLLFGVEVEEYLLESRDGESGIARFGVLDSLRFSGGVDGLVDELGTVRDALLGFDGAGASISFFPDSIDAGWLSVMETEGLKDSEDVDSCLNAAVVGEKVFLMDSGDRDSRTSSFTSDVTEMSCSWDPASSRVRIGAVIRSLKVLVIRHAEDQGLGKTDLFPIVDCSDLAPASLASVAVRPL